MKELKASRRYARALFELARDNGTLETTGQQMEQLAAVINSNEAARLFLSNALVDEESKKRFLEGLMSRLGTGEVPRRLVGLLLQRGRAVLLASIAEQYREEAEQHLGLVSAEVETPRPLSAQERTRLSESLGRYTGKQVRLSEHVRPELIAGLRIQIGSLLIDGTLERQLNELNRSILS